MSTAASNDQRARPTASTPNVARLPWHSGGRKPLKLPVRGLLDSLAPRKRA